MVTGTNPETFTGKYIYPTKTINFIGKINNGGQGTLNLPNDYGVIQFGPSGQPTTLLAIDPTPLINLPSGSGSTNSQPVYPPTNVVLISNPSPFFGGYNLFSGNYAGTIQDTTLNKTGVIAVNIGENGAISGSAVTVGSGTSLLTSISGTLPATGALNYVSQIDKVKASGTVTLENSTISGTLKLSNGDAATITLTQVQPLPPL